VFRNVGVANANGVLIIAYRQKHDRMF